MGQREVKAGEVYVPKDDDSHALIVKDVGEDGFVVYTLTSKIDHEDGKSGRFFAGMLEKYVLATSERLKGIISAMDEGRRIAQEEADFFGECSVSLKLFCEGLSSGDESKSRPYESPSNGGRSLGGKVLEFECSYGDCKFDYYEKADRRLKFLSCPHAELASQNPITLKCAKSGKFCQPLHG